MQIESKDIEKNNPKKVGVNILISDRADYRARKCY